MAQTNETFNNINKSIKDAPASFPIKTYNTTDFNFRVSQITRLNRKIGYKFPDNSQDWIVLRNDTDLKGIDPRFNDIYTIIKMLNAPTIDPNVKNTQKVVDDIKSAVEKEF